MQKTPHDIYLFSVTYKCIASKSQTLFISDISLNRTRSTVKKLK